MTKHDITPIFDNEDVVYTICLSGTKDLAQEFLGALDDRDLARFKRYFQSLHDGHHIKSPENMRHIKNVRDPSGAGAEVHELKTHRNGGQRLYVVKYAGKWYATHGRKKPKDRDVPKEAMKAFRIFNAANIESE